MTILASVLMFPCVFRQPCVWHRL